MASSRETRIRSKVQNFGLEPLLWSYTYIYLILYLSMTLFMDITSAATCRKIDNNPCKCQSETMTVDLKPLAKSATYSFQAQDEKEPSTKYYYNPCTPFPEKTPTGDTSVPDSLLFQLNSGHYYSLGNLLSTSSIEFEGSPEDSNLQIIYTTITGHITRTSMVSIICGDKDATFIFKTEVVKNTTYYMELHTALACPPSSVSQGISTGSVLVILFFVFVLVYLVAGTLFLRFVRGAEGVETFPNRAFWKDFPFLVRDGVYFVCRGCKSDITYEQI